MNDYSDFPPVKSFTRVIKICPRSAYLYLQLWKNKTKHMKILAEKKSIRKDYLLTPTLFRNLLAPLAYLNLIHSSESDEGFKIDLSGPQENA